MKAELLVATMLLMTSAAAGAQTACPQGVAAGGAQCGPSSLVDSSDLSRDMPPEPQAVWVDSWGAIASDAKGVFGIVTDLRSKRLAKAAAVDECRKRGGTCSVSLVFKNQCAAVGSSTQSSFASGAPTIEEATARAMKRCEDANGRGNCWVYYSGCSHAWRIQ
ncbi:DUF4189 domain-containing protein [Luteimonas mephitis]|uniref:DUF4189 domain-containing protein n=1 Tax=Luteimonas mephitis TaxID=83615 RepID=UPI00146A1C15|nr:DUF4189 domain-containing protein [Luteimonas mephitis]